MIDETPDLETRMEQAVLEVLRDAFPAVDEIAAWSAPRTDAGRYLSVRVETAGEEIPNTGIESLTVTITGKNLLEGERRILKDLYGSAGAARESLLINATGKFVLPAGEAVEVGPGTRVAEGNIDRLTSYNFTVSAQPFELILAA